MAELGEGQAQILIETGKALHLVMTAIALDTAPEAMKGKVVDQLRETILPAYISHLSVEVERAWRTKRPEFESMTGVNPENHCITIDYTSRGHQVGGLGRR